MEYLITLIIGIIGGYTLFKLKLPGGALIGSILFVAIYNVITGDAAFPRETKVIAQAVAGCFIGLKMQKKDLIEFKKVLKPAVFYLLSLIVISMGTGYIIHFLFDFDLATSLLSCVPGGMMDMSLISYDFNADTPTVTILQMMRMFLSLGVFPTISKHVAMRLNGESNNNSEPIENEKKEFKIENFLLTIIITIIGGTVGYYSGIPVGAMTVTMLFCSIFNIFTNRGVMPIKVRRLTQVFAGILIGMSMTRESLLNFGNVILPFLLIVIECILINFVVGWLLTKIGDIDITTALFSCNTAGASDMALIALDFGGDAPKVAVFQLVRYVGVLTLFPFIIKFLVGL